MYFKPHLLSVDGRRENLITDNPKPRFSWAAEHSEDGNFQTEYKIVAMSDDKCKWNSGWVKSTNQSAVYEGESIVSGEKIRWSVTLKDKNGVESESAENEFFGALMEKWSAPWIYRSSDIQGKVVYFQKNVNVCKDIKKAFMYVCGVGYHYVEINGQKADDAYLQPAVTNYAKNCYYVSLDVKKLLKNGENHIQTAVGEGWRRNDKKLSIYMDRQVEFFGVPALSMMLVLEYSDGTKEIVCTDESWDCGYGAIAESNIFDGEVYDEREEGKLLKSEKASILEGFSPKMRAQTIAPITAKEEFKPLVKTKVDGGYVFDFGINIAGFVRMRIPSHFKRGQKVKIHYAENILPDGNIDKETLRNAECTDTFISGEKDTHRIWEPKFTYHGFRYIFIEGYEGPLDTENFVAVAIYTDLENTGFFKCGSALVNKIQDIIIRTEKNNIHSITTDCPQRDERMMWLNDTTVRFEQMPYNFNMHALFSKMICDIKEEQREDGAIPCTAPYLFGNCPTDGVCSSYLIAAYENYIHYGDKSDIEKHYESFKMWNECLKNHREEGIVKLTHYGDWAGPAYACESMEIARSIMVPGELMSTGYHYYNYKLLEKFALILNDHKEAEYNRCEAQKVRDAFLEKWWDEESGKVWKGTQNTQAFSLWLDILPENGREKAAEVLHNAVADAGHKITTGNLTSRYIYDMLSKYGYTDDAWKLITREEYPSIGYMLQNGATTVWERFEFKRGSGMNSHDHPMYGAVGYWFYKFIAGLCPGEDGWQNFVVKPHIPKELLYAEAKVETAYGEIYVKWQKQMGQTDILLSVPFGTKAKVHLPWGECAEVTSGFHTFSYDEE